MGMINCRKCGKEIFYHEMTDVPWFPFCSERCRLIDLGQWLNEDHRISTPLEKKEEDGRPLPRREHEAESGMDSPDDSDED
jgi:hypothetical protein